jgi:RNA polymerase sigma factor, sigma-70 family
MIMSNEQLALSGDVAVLWDSLYRFTYQQTYRFHTSCADRCNRAGVTFNDLIQHAYIIMYNAVQLYKSDTYKFITYYGKSLQYGYLQLISYRKAKPLNNCTSLDKPLDDEEGSTLVNVVPDPDGETDIDNVIESEYQRELYRDVQLVLDMLPELERNVIRERFWNNSAVTDISAAYGVEIKEVRYTEAKALRILRSMKSMQVLRKYQDEI